jgi:hypothetical protein
MSEFDRREFTKIIGGGLAGLGALGSVSAATSTKQGTSSMSTKLSVNGSMPMSPALAKVMPESLPLMSALATEFAPVAAQMSTQQAYWLAFNAWITDRLSGPIMDGKVSAASVGEQAWAVHASGYWGGIEFRNNWGAPPAFSKPGIKRPVAAEVQQAIADKVAMRLKALAAGGDACLQLLSDLMHDDSTTGSIFTIAYNSGCQVVKTEDPPLGQRRPQRPAMPGAVRIYARSFMRVDYDLPNLTTPQYLKVWRSNFEKAVLGNPQAYEKALVGGSGQKDLRDIWKRGVEYGNITWGGDANDPWTQAYFNETVHWACVMGLGLEAVALASLVAVINQDAEAARRAVLGNTLFIGDTYGWGLGMADTSGKLPSIV